VTTFAALYQEHVQPRLERECLIHGTFVALGTESFADAAAAVRGVAMTRGGAHLPPALLDGVLDWIDGRLLHHAGAADVLVDQARAEAAHLPAPITCGADLAAWNWFMGVTCQTTSTL
jgi:hypothetical protein